MIERLKITIEADSLPAPIVIERDVAGPVGEGWTLSMSGSLLDVSSGTPYTEYELMGGFIDISWKKPR